MKITQLFVLLLLSSYSIVTAQSIGIGTTTPDASAQLDISTTTKGVLIPRMNTTSMNSITNPAKGLMVYDSSTNELMVNMGTAAIPNWKTVASNSSWNVTGNTGTNPSAHFIGTKDNAPLLFRVNNKTAGRIDSVSGNTSLGFQAGRVMTGSSNTAFGYKSLYANTSGLSNTSVGMVSLASNTTGNFNTAIGFYSLYSNTIGNSNLAIGLEALRNNTTGEYNIGIGEKSLLSNSSGSHNIAIGYLALRTVSTNNGQIAIGGGALTNCSTGNGNTAVGASSQGWNSTGSRNSTLGSGALFNNTTGSSNTAVGMESMYVTYTSSQNTALGFQAGRYFNIGWNNTLIGAFCNVSFDGTFNSVGLGENTTITANNQARIGNSSTSSIGGFTNWTNISDGRYKKDVRDGVKGLDFILKLRPVTYHLDVTKLREKLNEPNENLQESGMETAIADKESMIQTGFIAQEVEQAAMELGYDFSGVDKPKNENDLYGLRYAEFVVPLVKAVQELASQVDGQRLQIRILEKQNAESRKRIEELESGKVPEK